MFITFTRVRTRHANHSDGFGVSVVVADRPRAPWPPHRARKIRPQASPFLRRRRANVLWESGSGSLGPQDGPLAGKDGNGAREGGPVQKRGRLVRPGDERKPRLRRLSLRDAEAP